MWHKLAFFNNSSLIEADSCCMLYMLVYVVLFYRISRGIKDFQGTIDTMTHQLETLELSETSAQTMRPGRNHLSMYWYVFVCHVHVCFSITMAHSRNRHSKKNILCWSVVDIPRKIWVRQLGWWNSPIDEKESSHVPVTTNQPLLITINPLFIYSSTTIPL